MTHLRKGNNAFPVFDDGKISNGYLQIVTAVVVRSECVAN
jgi:hypothetical protein